MSTNWTPGPWSARENDILGPDGIEIAFAAMSDNGDEPVWYPAVANARLIASAPDLFAALTYLVENDRGTEETWAVADRALAKARGE